MFFSLQINERSAAEKCGLKVGDIIVRINNIDVTVMSHQMINEMIIDFTDCFTISVIRGCSEFICEQDTVGVNDFLETSIDDTDETIAEIISSEAEVLKDHNVIG